MFRLALCTTFALLMASRVPADEAGAIEVMIGYAAEDPDVPTLFLHQKKLQRRHEIDLLKGIMEVVHGLDGHHRTFKGRHAIKAQRHDHELKDRVGA